MKTRRFDPRTFSMIVILCALWIFFRIQVGGFYFSGDSVSNLTRDMATWAILAAGMTLVIVAGHIDLSVGSLMAVVTASCAYMLDPEYGKGWSATAAVPLALLIGATIGCLQGVLVAAFKVPAFIVTLGGLFVYRGITQKVSARDPRVPEDSWVTAFGFEYLPPSAGWTVGISVCALIALVVAWNRVQSRRRGLDVESIGITIAKAIVPGVVILGFVHKVNASKGVSYQTLVMATVLAALYVVSRHTRFGRHVYAIGGNPEAARLSGINVGRSIVGVFTIMGLLAGVAGVLWMAQNQGATKNAGTWYELYAIAACVIGGASLMGGRGTIFGTLLGALVMATVIQGMDYTDLDNWMQLVVRGSVLVIAVGIDIATKDPPRWMRRLRVERRKPEQGDQSDG
jgi:D-xylose transport system permease protein